MSITDLTRGEYRKIYAGWVRGRRINSVSYEAEPTFLRLNLIADNFGNFPADMDLLRAQAFVRRQSLKDDVIEAHLQELATARLIRFYEIGSDRYGHIVGFRLVQPAGRNGRLCRKCPEPPFNDSEGESLSELSGESGCIQGNPDASRGIPAIQAPTVTRTRTRNSNKNKNKNKNKTETEENSIQGDPLPVPAYRRSLAKAQLEAALIPLIGMKDGGRHPPKSQKWNQDTTMKDDWFNEIIWPEGSDPDEALRRLGKILNLVPKAAKNGKNPMAYLQEVIKRTLKTEIAS